MDSNGCGKNWLENCSSDRRVLDLKALGADIHQLSLTGHYQRLAQHLFCQQAPQWLAEELAFAAVDPQREVVILTHRRTPGGVYREVSAMFGTPERVFAHGV